VSKAQGLWGELSRWKNWEASKIKRTGSKLSGVEEPDDLHARNFPLSNWKMTSKHQLKVGKGETTRGLTEGKARGDVSFGGRDGYQRRKGKGGVNELKPLKNKLSVQTMRRRALCKKGQQAIKKTLVGSTHGAPAKKRTNHA